MSDSVKARAIDHVLELEGGFVDHPEDPGGATNMGITIGTLGEFRGGSVSIDDVKNLTREEAVRIYEARYWTRAKCDLMPAPIGFFLFDAAVNHGVGNATRMLQRALGVIDDGIIGPITLREIQESAPLDLLEEFAAQRMYFYGRISTFRTFGKGWSRRLFSAAFEAYSLA